MDNYKSKHTGTGVDHGVDVSNVLETDAVRITPQEFTETQKAQARRNIDALGTGNVDKTLTIEGDAADAKETGDRIRDLETKTQYTDIELGFDEEEGFIFADIDKSSDVTNGFIDDNGDVFLELKHVISEDN